jgi:hypothetical protein
MNDKTKILMSKINAFIHLQSSKTYFEITLPYLHILVDKIGVCLTKKWYHTHFNYFPFH